jgi:hypothetical protein
MRAAPNALTLIVEQIRDEMLKFEKDTVMGKAEDFGAYKFACGIYRGLMLANAIIADTVRATEEAEDA